MGSYYYVEMTLVRNSDVGLIQILNDYVNTHSYGYHNDFKHPDGTLEHALERLFPYCEKETDVKFTAEFNASYSWIGIILDVCMLMAPQLENGSKIEIRYDDYNSHTTIQYKNGNYTIRDR